MRERLAELIYSLTVLEMIDLKKKLAATYLAEMLRIS
jgi:hypothetical protein